MYAHGNFAATGNGVVNRNGKPDSVVIYGSPTENGKSVKIAGNGGFFGVLYAPNNDVDVVGNKEFFGALLGNNLTFTGNATFHYDEDLADFEDDGLKRITRWDELTDAGQHKNMSNILNVGF